MKVKLFPLTLILLISLNIVSQAQSTKFSAPIVNKEVIFEEKDGLVAVEAECFYKQTKPEIETNGSARHCEHREAISML